MPTTAQHGEVGSTQRAPPDAGVLDAAIEVFGGNRSGQAPHSRMGDKLRQPLHAAFVHGSANLLGKGFAQNKGCLLPQA